MIIENLYKKIITGIIIIIIFCIYLDCINENSEKFGKSNPDV